MTFIQKTLEVGRRAANIVELELDRCSRSYGISPCTATLAQWNNFTQSQTLDHADWDMHPLLDVVANDTLAPDGTMTADRVEANSNANLEYNFFRESDVTVMPVFTWNYAESFYFKADEIELIQLTYAEAGIELPFASFDVKNGIMIDSGNFANAYFVGADIHAVDSVVPGWFRCTLRFKPGLPIPGTETIGFRFLDASGAFVFSPTIGDGLYVWGGQMRGGTPALSTDPQYAGIYTPTTTAAINGMGVNNDLCFNTFATCQDTPNYNNVPQTYRFIDRLDRPADITDAVPCISKVSYGATRLEPGGGLAFRGKVTVTLQDFTTNDNTLDDYRRERTYDPLERSTFFGKLKARNKFYIGRPMRVLEGYIDEPFDFANFRTREYIIESIVGPDKTGKVSIIGKDPLSLAKNDRAKAPTASVGTLLAGITAGATSLTVSVGDGPDYDVDPHIRIDDEIMLIGVRAGDVLPVTRGQGGTTAAAHTAGAAVQSCLTYDDEPVIDIIQELLEDFANIDPAYIPFVDWQAEETASLSGYDLTTIISEPTGVQKLLKEIVEITLLDIWYSDVDQEIKLKLQTPFTDVDQLLTDADNVLENSLRLKDDNNRRLTRVLIYYGIRNFARDLTETENYSLVNFEIEADKEGANKFNDEKIRVIFSRWMDSSNLTQIGLTSQRLLARFGNMPIEISFTLDAKDVPTLKTGDVYDLQTRIIPGALGLPETTRFQVVETKPLKPSSQYRYRSLAFFADPEPDSITIAANETNYDLFVELGGPPGPVDVTVTINAGVFVRSTNGFPAFKTEGMHPDSTIVLINNGHIHGHGGDGGNGGSATIGYEKETSECYFFGFAQNGIAGQAGGDAIVLTVADITIDNTNGDIFGGGGGGGGGDGYRASFSSVVYGGGGGGGGLGEDTASGGALGTATISPGSFGDCGPDTEVDGNAGTGGTDVAAGTGGAGGGLSRDGGDGGADWGDPGDAGNFSAGGGAGGFAVRLNGASITWTGGNSPAKVKGAVA